MSRTVQWIGASAGSLVLHAGVLAVLLGSFDPDPPNSQGTPPAAFEVVPTTVRSETAAALPTEAAAVAPADPEDTRVDGGTIPTTSGRAVPLSQLAVVARAPEGAVVAEAPMPAASPPTRPDALRLAPAAASGALATAIDPPQPTATAAIQPPVANREPAAPADLDGARLAAVPVPAIPAPPLPDAATALASTPSSQPAQAGQVTEGRRTSAEAPAGPPATEVLLPSEAMVAALGWTGDAAEVDPKSLAAVGAFLTLGASGESESLRDRVSQALTAVDCARLQTAFDPSSGSLEVRGHVPEDGLRAVVTAALVDQIGDAIPVVDRLQVLPRPQCSVLGQIEAVGLAQSDEQALDPRIIGPDTHVREYRYAEGDRLVLDVMSPDYPAVVYIDYFDASGTVLHLQPNATVAADVVPPDTALSIGTERPGQPSLELTVGPPYGQEIAVAFATSHPLYEGVRPLTEPADGYLAFLRDRVAAARARHSDFKGEWVYFFVSTRERW